MKPKLKRLDSPMGQCTVADGVLVSAVRYSLGRMTYIVSETCDEARRNIPNIHTKLIAVMVRDIQEHERDGNMGMDFDRAEWLQLQSDLQAELRKREASNAR